jgi:hypothetical protein
MKVGIAGAGRTGGGIVRQTASAQAPADAVTPPAPHH